MQKQDQAKQNLENIRKKINQTDQRLVNLLEQRLLLALSALAYKKQVLNKKREAEILKKTPSRYLKAIFQQILTSTKIEQRERHTQSKNNKSTGKQITNDSI